MFQAEVSEQSSETPLQIAIEIQSNNQNPPSETSQNENPEDDRFLNLEDTRIMWPDCTDTKLKICHIQKDLFTTMRENTNFTNDKHGISF